METNQKLTLSILTLLSSLSLWSCVQPGELDLTSHPAKSRAFTAPPATLPPVVEPLKIEPPAPPEFIKINRQAKIKIEAQQKVDVLFVDDNSKSMMSTQRQMAQKFNNFIDTLDGLDWQVAITTTDVEQYQNDMRPIRFKTQEDIAKGRKIKNVKAVGHDGRFLQFPNGQYILNSSLSKSNAQQQFAKTIQRPLEEGSQYEQGIKATYRSIERMSETATAEGKAHAAFFRSDASLAVVFITDADESIPKEKTAEESNTPMGLLGLMEKTFGAKKIIFHSIVVPDGDVACRDKKNDRHEEFGLSYIKLSQMTNGEVGSVCSTDYAKQLKFMGEKVQEKIHTWELECADAEDLVLTNLKGEVVKMAMSTTGSKVHFSQTLHEGEYNLDYTCKLLKN